MPRSGGWTPTACSPPRAAEPASARPQRGPRLFARDVLEPVAGLAAERGADHDLQAGALARVVEGGVDDACLEEHRVARPQRRRLPLDELGHLPLLHDDHLLLARMPVEVVPLSGLERHVHDHQLRRALVGREAPADHAPVEALLPDVGLLHERAAHRGSPWSTGMALKRRMFSVIATSVGRRSIELAPKKPTTPSVRASTYAASSGSAIGPPWQRQRMSGSTSAAASRSAWTRSTASSSVLAVCAP